MSEDAAAAGKRPRSDSPEDKREAAPASGGAPDSAMMDEDDDDDVGPMPMAESGNAAAPRKKRKGVPSICPLRPEEMLELTILLLSGCLYGIVLKHEQLFLDHLPSADRYSKSFMHRDVLNFVTVTK